MITTQLARNTARVVVIAATIALLASCATPPGRSGAPVDPVTITSTWGGINGIGPDILDSLVNSSTESAVTISTPVDLPTRDPNDEEGSAVSAVKAGTADLTIVRGDSLVAAGADSLAPLQAPLVVSNSEQAAKIAADPVAKDLMSGLRKIGLVGLGLAPGGLRYPFGYSTPLFGTDDYEGKVINTRVGPGVDVIVQALGAKTDHSVEDERDLAARNGKLRGIETSLLQAQAVTTPAVLTSNVVLYEKFDVVVIRADVYDSLSEAQQKELSKRVLDSIAATLKTRAGEDTAFQSWCASPGASAENASAEDISALSDRLQPVLSKLEKSPKAAKAIGRMIDLHKGTTDQTLGTCVGGVSEVPPISEQVAAIGDQTALDGKWKVEVTQAELLAGGASQSDARASSGIWIFTIKNGYASVDQPQGPDCEAQFTFNGDQLSINFDILNGLNNCGGYIQGTYQVQGKTAKVTWTSPVAAVGFFTAFFQHGLLKVG